MTERPQTSTVTWQDQGITHALHRFTVSTVADPEGPAPYQAYGSDYHGIPPDEQQVTHLGLSVRGTDPRTQRWLRQRLRFELEIDQRTWLALPGRLLGAQGGPGRLSSSPLPVFRSEHTQISDEAQVWYAFRQPVALRHQPWSLQLHYSGAPVGAVVSAYLLTQSLPEPLARAPAREARKTWKARESSGWDGTERVDTVQWYTRTRSEAGANRLGFYPPIPLRLNPERCVSSRLGTVYRGLVDHLGVELTTTDPALAQALLNQSALVLQWKGQAELRWPLRNWDLAEGVLSFLPLPELIELPQGQNWTLDLSVPRGIDSLPEGDFALTACLLGWGEREML